MGKTKIPYADEVWNVTRGCSQVSAGCDHCWALRQASRFAGPGAPFHGIAARTDGGWRWMGEAHLVEHELEAPLHWRRPRTVFVCSMSDLFHSSVRSAWIEAVWSVMARCPQHRFLVFTKRPHRFLACALAEPLPPHVTVMVSAEDQVSLDRRLPPLLRSPAASIGVSLEPLLGPVGFVPAELEALSWVIVGAESGPGRRPMELDWVRSIRDQCVEAGTAFYFKQAVIGGQMVTLPELDGQVWDETLPLPEVDR